MQDGFRFDSLESAKDAGSNYKKEPDSSKRGEEKSRREEKKSGVGKRDEEIYLHVKETESKITVYLTSLRLPRMERGGGRH